jgi:hypothetical protein
VRGMLTHRMMREQAIERKLVQGFWTSNVVGPFVVQCKTGQERRLRGCAREPPIGQAV